MQTSNDLPDNEFMRENEVDTGPGTNGAKQPFVTPKLTFLTPTLTKQGSVTALTAALLASFSP